MRIQIGEHVLSSFPEHGSAIPPSLELDAGDGPLLLKLRDFLHALGVDVRSLANERVLDEVSRRIHRGELFLKRKDEPDPAPPPPAMPPPAEKEDAPPPKEEERSKPTSDPVLVQVEWTDGAPDKLVSGSPIQWVNIDPKDTQFVDGKLVASVDRLGFRPKVKVRFDKPGGHAFKLRLIPGAKNAVYSAAEKGRTSWYTFLEKELSFTTDGDGTKVIDGDVFLTLAGNDTYVVEAEDNKGTKKRSSTLTTRRLVFVQEIKMLDEAGKSADAKITTQIDTVKAEYRHCGIHVEPIAEATMPHVENFQFSAESSLKASLKAAYTGADKETHIIVIAYVGHMAEKAPDQEFKKSGIVGGQWGFNHRIPLVDAAGKARYLWRGLGGPDAWFVSATFRKDGGTAADDVVIPPERCYPVAPDTKRPHRYSIVEIENEGLPVEKGTITLKVHCVESMLGGLSRGGIVWIATRGWWEANSAAEQNQVIVHEMGHSFDMVCNGTGQTPDMPANRYEAHGHSGPHCHTGVPERDDYSVGDAGRCVMFGAMNGKTKFCEECGPAVRKMNLYWGLYPF